MEIRKTAPGQATISVSNPGSETAFFIRLKILKEDNELALPVFLSDNFITLFPGETNELKVDCSGHLKEGQHTLRLMAEGWNVPLYEAEL